MSAKHYVNKMLNRIRFKDEAAEAIYEDQGLHDIEDFS